MYPTLLVVVLIMLLAVSISRSARQGPQCVTILMLLSRNLLDVLSEETSRRDSIFAHRGALGLLIHAPS